MLFEALGDRQAPAVLFFHAMGVTGASSEPVARYLRYGSLRRQLADSLTEQPFPPLPEGLQRRTYFAFGSREEHYKYRDAVMRAYPQGYFPVFEGYDHMQYQIRDPQGFAALLRSVMEQDALPPLPMLRP